VRYFIVEFDGHSYPAKLTEFANRDAALEELSIREPLEPPSGETVLLFADSEDVLRVTHSRYFEDPLDTFRRTLAETTSAAQT
jgi:hypothetical protein